MDAVVLTEESTERSNLYKIALQHIHGTVKQQARPNFDRTHCLDYKVAFLFESLATDEVKALCYMNSLDQSNGGVEQFVKGLLQLKTLGHKLHRVYKLKNDQPDCRGILQALKKLVEQGCAASTLSKSMLADVFEMNTSPRKCNGLMTVGPIEVRNLKCKRVGASQAEVACQLKKNTKINKSILLQLQDIIISAIVFRVRKWKDIWGAANGASTTVLPTTEDEFRLLLEGTVHNLCNCGVADSGARSRIKGYLAMDIHTKAG
ncbi:MAG: hypothetical protein BYD32DRAFT_457717 [Podila humilis]|nr:MAG: hypothetical protein BYD32DRAFT_457717 [Podila humilis]